MLIEIVLVDMHVCILKCNDVNMNNVILSASFCLGKTYNRTIYNWCYCLFTEYENGKEECS